MCILFIYCEPNPEPGKYQLILASNRDEYFVRPAKPAHYWPEDEYIIGGKDLEAGREGGTWFGISLRNTQNFKLRMATLLNVTGEPRNPEAAGRGSIVTDYLKSDMTAESYIEQKLRPVAKSFNAFSFVAVELNNDVPKILHYTNVIDKVTSYSRTESTFSGFGNSLLYEPFAKVQAGQRRFQSLITNNSLDDVRQQAILKKELIKLLKWNEPHLPDNVLSRRAPDTFQYLCSVFVDIGTAGYGTRTHSVVTVDAEGNVEFLEDTVDGYTESGDVSWVQNQFQAKI